MSFHLLIIDDDQRIRLLLQRFLRHHGYTVSTAAHPVEAMEILSRPLSRFHLILLDDMMPYQTGRDFLALFRGQGNTLPVLMLTAKGETADRIAGLSLGADDYVAKPFDPEELLLRIQNLLRRAGGPSDPAPAPLSLRLGPLTYQAATYKLLNADGTPIPLTPAEKTLMDVLVRARGQSVSRLALQTALGMEETSLSRTIDVHLNRLRQKIEPHPKTPQYLQTVRHQGYRLMGDDV
jgi:two-component system phosphate regulon response regulator OmpR